MKILSFVDLHLNKKALEIIKEKAEKADIVLCGGDLSVFEEGLSQMLEYLAQIKKPVFHIHGNHEDPVVLEQKLAPYEHMAFVHGALVDLGDYQLFAYGGGGFSERDMQFEELAKAMHEKITKPLIFMTHGPPHGTKLDKLGQRFVGNKSFTKFIEIMKPVIAISGHLHENSMQKDKIGKSLLVNPGPEGMLITL